MTWDRIQQNEMRLPGWFLDLYWHWRKFAEPLYAHRRSKGDFLEDYPLTRVFASSSRVCNAKCGFCAYPLIDSPKDFLSLELFQDFARQWVAMGGDQINLTPTFGEPLTDPLLAEKIAFARQQGLKVYFTTNAILLAKRAKEICDAGVSGINVSLPSFDREEYMRVYRVDKAEEMYQGIKSYLAAKQPEQTLALQFRHACPPSSLLSHPRFKEVKELAGPSLHWEFTYGFDNWMGQVDQSNLPEGMWFRKVKFGKFPCRWAFSMTLDPTGEVRICGCRYAKNFNPDLVLGHLSEGLEELWESRAKSVLRDFYFGTLKSTCQSCTFYQAARAEHLGITKFGNVE